jgi:fructose-1,6-bisphosphatase/inositol monophosphatase family enzyme
MAARVRRVSASRDPGHGTPVVPDVSVHVNVAVDVLAGSVRLACRSCGRFSDTRCGITQSLAESVERIRIFGSAALDLAFVAKGRTDAHVILANKPSQAL